MTDIKGSTGMRNLEFDTGPGKYINIMIGDIKAAIIDHRFLINRMRVPMINIMYVVIYIIEMVIVSIRAIGVVFNMP